MTTDMELELFCRNIQNLRKHYKLSQKEIARRLHIGVGSLRKLESGKVPPQLRIGVLFYIYRHFGITPTKIVTLDVLQEISQMKDPHHQSCP